MTSAISDPCKNCGHDADDHVGVNGYCWAVNAIFLFTCTCNDFEPRND